MKPFEMLTQTAGPISFSCLPQLLCACMFLRHQSLRYCGLAENQRKEAFEISISIKIKSFFVLPAGSETASAVIPVLYVLGFSYIIVL